MRVTLSTKLRTTLPLKLTYMFFQEWSLLVNKLIKVSRYNLESAPTEKPIYFKGRVVVSR